MTSPPCVEIWRLAAATPGSSTVTVSASSLSTICAIGIQLPLSLAPAFRSSRLSKRRLISLWILASSSMDPSPFVIVGPSLPRFDQIAELRHELLDVLELPVNRREAHVGDLVELLEL